MLLAGAGRAQAAVIAEDAFNYLAGGGGLLHAKNGGTGWGGAWATNGQNNVAAIADATGNELTFSPPGGVLIDGGVECVDITAGSGINQPVAHRPLAGTLNGTFHVAYLLRLVSGSWGGNNTFSIHLSDGPANVSTLNFGIRGGTGHFMIRNGTGAPLTGDSFGGTVAANTTYCLVARLSKPAGSSRYDRIDVWLNPAISASNTPNATLTLTAGSGLAGITHVILRAAALDGSDTIRVDELRLGTDWIDVLTPGNVTPTVQSFSLMYPGTAGPVSGYDPLTNNAIVNLAVTGTNLNIRANTIPSTDFGSVALALSGTTARTQVENGEPWALFGDGGGAFNGGQFNLGAHTLTGTPYDADGGATGGGSAGNPLSIQFSVINTPPNVLPSVSLTNPANGASFTAPASILLEATASDVDGSVAGVEFFAGSTKVGEAGAAPYRFLWTNVASGAYALTARATDKEGGVGVSPAVTISVLSTNTNGVISGELKKWHRVTLAFDGPATSETATPNPFRDYRLNVTFTHPASAKSYLVPGHFAADGNAANTGADSGNQWRAHFAPDETGTWDYVASFRAGTDVAISANPSAGTPSDFDGASGSFVIGPTDKTGRDHRGKGRLQYVGKHHLRFAETGEYFLKVGADAPENLLAYDDFDATPNTGNRRKSWSPHARDYDPADAAEFTWKNGKGTNLLGAIKYLASEGLNAFSFLTFNVDGDDDNVFPHRLTGSVASYEAVSDNQRWASGTLAHDRFDVSKLDQWERLFAYGDKLGMYLHFKTLETENELKMDGGDVGPERSLYYRELISRFGHHLALNWNLGEEINSASTAQKQAWSQYLYDHDPYRHHQVIHNGANHYDLLGNASKLTGFSLQTSLADFSEVHSSTRNYLDRSVAAGKPWVVACDEPGDASLALVPDSDIATYDPERNNSRRNGLWGHLMAGGAGLEWYFGYNRAQSDLTCEDWRSRDQFWDLCRYAWQFFKDNEVPFWDMTTQNALTSAAGGYCLYQSNQVYVVFLKSAAVTTLDLRAAAGPFSVQWFDPRNGGALQSGSITQVTAGVQVSLGNPPASSANDWVALVRAVTLDTQKPTAFLLSPTNGQQFAATEIIPVSAIVADDVAVAWVELHVDGVVSATNPGSHGSFTLGHLSLGAHTLAVVGVDTSGNRATNAVSVTVVTPPPPQVRIDTLGGGQYQVAWDEAAFALQAAPTVLGTWTNVIPQPASSFPIAPEGGAQFFRLQWNADK